MQISANKLPVLPLPSADTGRRDKVERVQQPGQDLRHQHSSRQATEYVFDGDLEDANFSSESARQVFNQRVAPVNRGAILSYATTATSSFDQPERVGRHLDLFL